MCTLIFRLCNAQPAPSPVWLPSSGGPQGSTSIVLAHLESGKLRSVLQGVLFLQIQKGFAAYDKLCLCSDQVMRSDIIRIVFSCFLCQDECGENWGPGIPRESCWRWGIQVQCDENENKNGDWVRSIIFNLFLLGLWSLIFIFSIKMITMNEW